MASLIELLKRYKPQSDEDFMQQAAADEMFPPQRWTGDGVDMGNVTPMPKKVGGGALWPVAIMDDGSRELDWGEGITGAAYDAFTAPKRAYDGEFDPLSDDGIGEAFKMAGMLMGGGFGRAAGSKATAELGSAGGNLKPPLPMDFESRMARAEAMGFDPHMTWSHYSPRAGEIDRFDPSEIGRNFGVNHGYHFTDDATIGAHYGDSSVDVVLPHETSMVNINLRDYADNLPMLRSLTGQKRLSEQDVAFHSPSSFFDEYAPSLEANLPSDKFGYILDDGKSRQTVVFDNTKIRKSDAKFDPANADSADLLAAGSPFMPLMPREKKERR